MLNNIWSAWKLSRNSILGITVLVATSLSQNPAHATSSADAQVEKIFGIPPWNEVTNTGFLGTVGAGWIRFPLARCEEGRFFPVGSDIFTASDTCSSRFFGQSGFFRSDLGVDSTGSVPPSGKLAFTD